MLEKARILTFSNLLSFIRIIFLIPILISLTHENKVWFLIWTVLACSTDFLDGYFARRWNQRSDIGRIIDPLADKIVVLVVIVFLVISPLYDFPLWFFVFLLMKELIQLFCGLLIVRRKNIVMESNRHGKNSAFATGSAVFLFAIKFQPYGWIMLWIAFMLTIYSSWIYYRLFINKIS